MTRVPKTENGLFERTNDFEMVIMWQTETVSDKKYPPRSILTNTNFLDFGTHDSLKIFKLQTTANGSSFGHETWQASWWHLIFTRNFYSKTFWALLPEKLRSRIWDHPGGRWKVCPFIARALVGVRLWNFVGRCNYEGIFHDNC